MNTGREGKRQPLVLDHAQQVWCPASGFQTQQPLLGGQPTGETGEAARGSDHPMARCNNGQWVPSVGGSNRPYCVGAADLHGYFRIAAGLAEWNGEQGGPDLFLKFGTLEVEREFEPGTFAGKIFPQLAFGFRQEGACPRRAASRPAVLGWDAHAAKESRPERHRPWLPGSASRPAIPFSYSYGACRCLLRQARPVYYAMGFQQGSLQMAGEAGRSAIGPMDGRLLPGMPSPPWSPGRAPRTVRSGRRFAEQSGLSLVCHLMGSDEASSKGCNGFCLANGLLRKKAAALLAWLPFSDPAQPGGCAKFLAVWIAPIAAAYEARGSSPRNFFVRTPNIALRPAPLVSRS